METKGQSAIFLVNDMEFDSILSGELLTRITLKCIAVIVINNICANSIIS